MNVKFKGSFINDVTGLGRGGRGVNDESNKTIVLKSVTMGVPGPVGIKIVHYCVTSLMDDPKSNLNHDNKLIKNNHIIEKTADAK